MPESDLFLQGLIFREGMGEDGRPRQVFDLHCGPLGADGFCWGHPPAEISLVRGKKNPPSQDREQHKTLSPRIVQKIGRNTVFLAMGMRVPQVRCCRGTGTSPGWTLWR